MDYLAKEILFKFYNEERYKNLKYTKGNGPYTFENDNTFVNVAIVNEIGRAHV